MNRKTVIPVVGLAIVAAAGVGGFALTQLRSSTPTSALGPPRFVEEAATAGIDHRYDGDFIYSVGGGVAAFDCNGDGRQELYLAGGSEPAALYRNDSRLGGALRFTPVPDPATDLTRVNGAYPIDIDGDRQVDLAVLRIGESVLLRGLGDCRFERANEAWSFDGGPAWTTAFSAKWEGADRLPTLAIGHYRLLDGSGEATLDCDQNELVRPALDGTAYAPPIALRPGYCALSMLFSDWDRSGRRDLRVSNDRHYYDFLNGEEQLWRIDAGKAPRRYTDADGWVPTQIWGMGIASHDLTGDGYPEVFLTNQGENKLQTLTVGPDKPTYRDIGLKRGANAAEPFTGGDTLPSTGWHAEFQDVNNDGFVDLFIAKGNVSDMPDFAQRDPSNLLLGQADGTFREGAEGAGIVDFGRGRGGALVDLNLDGLLDLVKLDYGSPIKLWRNVGQGDGAKPSQMGGWLALRVSQPSANRDAVGAWIEVQVGDTTLRREITIGGGHVGGQLGWVHFGLGPASEAQVRVLWPDGATGPWMRVAANQFADIERGTNEARRWLPPSD
ncbi:MAG: CRTAC1 family protein [Chloroflexota bacterium]|nr:CRTAC1 family protein [Chloroflexota bacterium]